MEAKDFVNNIADNMISPWKRAELEQSRSIESQAKSLDDDQFEEMLRDLSSITSSVKLDTLSLSDDGDWSYRVKASYVGYVTPVYEGVRFIQTGAYGEGEWIESTKLVPVDMTESVEKDIGKINDTLSNIGIAVYRSGYHNDEEPVRVTRDSTDENGNEERFVAHYECELMSKVVDKDKFEEYCKKFST